MPRRADPRSGSRAAPVETCTSTVTGRPSTPRNVAERTAASMRHLQLRRRNSGAADELGSTRTGLSTVAALYPPAVRPQRDDADLPCRPGRLVVVRTVVML